MWVVRSRRSRCAETYGDLWGRQPDYGTRSKTSQIFSAPRRNETIGESAVAYYSPENENEIKCRLRPQKCSQPQNQPGSVKEFIFFSQTVFARHRLITSNQTTLQDALCTSHPSFSASAALLWSCWHYHLSMPRTRVLWRWPVPHTWSCDISHQQFVEAQRRVPGRHAAA